VKHRGAIGALAAVALLFFAVKAIGGEIPRGAELPAKIEVRAQPITAFEPRDPARQRFGALEYRGGMVLTSTFRQFGGFSGIRVGADGATFLAVSDIGRWWRGRIVYEGKRPAGIVDAEMAPLLGADGKPLGARRWYDSESLAIDGGTVYVGIERVDQIVRFDYGRSGLLARGQPIAVPPEFKKLPYNKSLECLEFVPRPLPLAGTLIVVTERGLDAQGNLLSFLIKGTSFGNFSVKRSDDFDVSDCALLPGGDLLILERRYSPWRGVAMRIRRLPMASIKPGALVDGETLIEADMGYQIDNMEGLSVHRAGDGSLVLTLVSDDNFSFIQRTILLQFTLMQE
jgi:hypothetical protein